MRSMVRFMVLITLSTLGFIFSSAAHAGMSCTVYIAGDQNDPNNENKALFEAPVVRSPSNDPQDPKRYTFVAVKADLSSASIMTAEKVAEYTKTGAAAEAGNYLVTLQETITPNVYTIIIRKFDASTEWYDAKNWLGVAYGGAPVFGLDIPSTKFSVLCESK